MKCEITRVVAGYAYPKNGNFHNPTPRYRWDVTYDGKRVGSTSTAKGAKEMARMVEENPTIA